MSDELNVLFTIPINKLGFGMFSLGVIKALQDANMKIGIIPINANLDPDLNEILEDIEYNKEEFQALLDNGKDLNFIKEASHNIVIWHPQGCDTYLQKDKINILWTHFETTYLSDKTIHSVSLFDKILVCSHAAEIILNSLVGNKTISLYGPVIPAYLDYKPSPLTIIGSINQFIDTENRAICVSSGKWEKRKNHMMIVDSFVENSGILLGVWSNPFTGGLKEPIEYLTLHGWYAVGQFMFEGSKEPATVFKNKHNKQSAIVMFPYIKRYRDVLRLFKTGHIYIAISSGEGWDMPAVEASSLGLLCILSNNTAHELYDSYQAIGNPTQLDIISSVPCRRKLAIDGKWFHGEGYWWEPHEASYNQILAFSIETAENAIKKNDLSIVPLRVIRTLNAMTLLLDIDKILWDSKRSKT